VKLPTFKHMSQVLSERLDGLRFKKDAMKGVKVTYQDPCRLGRDCGIFEEPRSLICRADGIELVEMKKNRRDAVCCGAGGGVKLTNSGLAEWMGTNRVEMAKETGSSMIITACPWCDKNFKDAVREEDGIKMQNLIDLMDQCIED